ncbi:MULTISPECIES: AfsR/SARP family transcriptional regulator [Streptomyces]|uniref:AfsR/SARP family transcriptional regulator n=1 Tax=Streptomyces TaxID=1883 RepID=UPI000CF2B7D6|nr:MULTISPECIES: BTAD domain-containing putative transcriptional regulator [Streptomyces]PPS69365.1 hypothetical protein BV882_27530 [Streptomyces sp. 46]
MLAQQVRFGILGPLDIRCGDELVEPGGLVPAVVLGLLLLAAGRAVPLHRIVDAVWDDLPPETASHQVRKAVSVLRRRIPEGDRLIVTQTGGYRIDPGVGQLDAAVFTGLLGEAQALEADGRTNQAVDRLREALALWRGHVLQGLPGSFLEAAATTLDERRLEAMEHCFDLRLELGEAAGLVSELRSLIAEHPLREAPRRQLMLALYRSGRQAEALEEFASLRTLLTAELGVAPGAKLSALRDAILRQAPELDGAPSAVTAESAEARVRQGLGVPRTLPSTLSDFTGRRSELARIAELAGQTPTGPAIVVIDSMAGSGKTALAVHSAHQLAHRYPDGQLFLDLRGHSGEHPPLDVGTALDMLACSFGVPAEQHPGTLVGKTALWRRLSAGRRLLLILDDAVSADQARTLLPASSQSLVLVTSRNRLPDVDGALWLPLRDMPHEDGVQLLRRALGPHRSSGASAAVHELVELCGGLPLALRLAAARLLRRPGRRDAELVERLRDERKRIDELYSPERSIAGALARSYENLPEELRSALHVLARHSASDLTHQQAIALLEAAPRAAEDILDRLLDANLIRQDGRCRYAFHPLVRGYALCAYHPALVTEGGCRGPEDPAGRDHRHRCAA